jgi:hypothetical protein
LIDTLRLPGAIDGELLIVRDGHVQSFNVLQQRLNRKTVNAKLLSKFPAHIRAYDLLVDGDEDLRGLPFMERRARLERFISRLDSPRVDISPLVPFTTWDSLAAARADPASAGADTKAVEGIMLKRRDSPYVPGRPKGLWWKWKRDPMTIDAVLMYAQRGHGKRSSFYSDYTFGVWTNGKDGDELVPVGKAYFGFTDEELQKLWPRARRRARARQRSCDGGCVRRIAALDPAQVGARDAFPSHQPPAVGQAARRGRPTGDTGEHLAKNRRRARTDGHCGDALSRYLCYRSTNSGAAMSNGSNALHRFLGGPPLAVLGKLVLLSILIGVVLSALGLDPWNIVESVRRLIRSIWDMGFDAIRWLWQYFLLGAVLVIPIWLILRIVRAPKGR